MKKLRAGDLSTVIAIGIVIYVMFQLSGVDAFPIIAQWNAPVPELHRVPTQAQEFNDMSLIF